MVLCERVVGFESGVLVGLGVDLSTQLWPLGVSSEGRAARLPSRIVAMTGFALAAPALVFAEEPELPVGSDSVPVDSFSLFITSANALPTERAIVEDSRFERKGRVGELI